MKRPEKKYGWDEEADVVVVGFGGAGACAAIQAADEGASVLVVERFDGGGATRRSGGAIYAGGGSRAQRAAGFDDDAGRMLLYLRRETGGAVSDGVLRAFCEESLGNLEWLESLGLRFPEKFFPHKTTQPPDGFGLYYSGNEKQGSGDAPPVPRGHVPAGVGMTGSVLFDALARAAIGRGVRVRRRSRPTRLLMDGSGAVTGLELVTLPGSAVVRGLHAAAGGLGFVSRSLVPVAGRLEEIAGRRSRVRARGGVVVSAGGFIFNAAMVNEHARPYARCMPLGTPGDDGSGIMLGVGAGGATVRMEEAAAWRFIYPPEAFVMGVLVNALGERICDESLYGATLCRAISSQPGGKAWLIVDGKILRRVRVQLEEEPSLRSYPPGKLLSGELNALVFRKLNALLNMHVNRKRASSVERLERKCGMPRGALVTAIASYNEAARSGERDRFGKAAELVSPLEEAPFLAVNCDLHNRIFLGPCITLGGLRTDGRTAQVLRGDGTPIPGLFAAGRSAAGICSGGYVSGLSIADCIFSGRNAGRSAAAARGEAGQP
jgi:3-oxo-5alpha-steroid 4-dehydrogenase